MDDIGSVELLTVDMVMGFAVFEALLLAIVCRRAARGPSFAGLVPNLTAGLCLMLALRSALTSNGWPALALWLAAAGVAHGVDLWIRWRRSGSAVDRPASARASRLVPMHLATGSGYPVSATPDATALYPPDVAPVDAVCRQPSPAPRNLENFR